MGSLGADLLTWGSTALNLWFAGKSLEFGRKAVAQQEILHEKEHKCSIEHHYASLSTEVRPEP